MSRQARTKPSPSAVHPITIYLKLLLATLFWGGAFVAGRVISKDMEHFSIAFLRFSVACLLLLPLMWKTEGGFVRLTKSQFISIILLGLTGVFAYNAMFFKGLQTIEASRAALIIATCPVFITIFSGVFFRDRISPAKMFGIMISVCGAAIVVCRGKPAEIFKGNLGWGEFYMFCCVLSWVAYSLIGKSVMKEISPIVAVTYSAVVGAVALFVPALFEGLLGNLTRHSATAWLIILYLGVFATVVGFLWYYEAIRRIGPVRAGLFINFVPVFTIVLAFIILREEITVSLAIGAVLVISGVYLTNRTPKVRAT